MVTKNHLKSRIAIVIGSPRLGIQMLDISESHIESDRKREKGSEGNFLEFLDQENMENRVTSPLSCFLDLSVFFTISDS